MFCNKNFIFVQKNNLSKEKASGFVLSATGKGSCHGEIFFFFFLPEMGNYLAFPLNQREKQVHLSNRILMPMSSPRIILVSCHCVLSLKS